MSTTISEDEKRMFLVNHHDYLIEQTQCIKTNITSVLRKGTTSLLQRIVINKHFYRTPIFDMSAVAIPFTVAGYPPSLIQSLSSQYPFDFC